MVWSLCVFFDYFNLFLFLHYIIHAIIICLSLANSCSFTRIFWLLHRSRQQGTDYVHINSTCLYSMLVYIHSYDAISCTVIAPIMHHASYLQGCGRNELGIGISVIRFCIFEWKWKTCHVAPAINCTFPYCIGQCIKVYYLQGRYYEFSWLLSISLLKA